MRVLNVALGGEFVIRKDGLIHILKIVPCVMPLSSVSSTGITDIELMAEVPHKEEKDSGYDAREDTSLLILLGKYTKPMLADTVLDVSRIVSFSIATNQEYMDVAIIGGNTRQIPASITVRLNMTVAGVPKTFNKFMLDSMRTV